MAITFLHVKLYIKHILTDLCHQPLHSINHSSRSFLATKVRAFVKFPRQLSSQASCKFSGAAKKIKEEAEEFTNQVSWQSVHKGLWWETNHSSASMQAVSVMKTRAHLKEKQTDLSVWLQFYEVQYWKASPVCFRHWQDKLDMAKAECVTSVRCYDKYKKPGMLHTWTPSKFQTRFMFLYFVFHVSSLLKPNNQWHKTWGCLLPHQMAEACKYGKPHQTVGFMWDHADI